MKDEIEKAIAALTKKAVEETQPHMAMQLSQAALNLAHAYATMKGAAQLKG